MKRQLPRKRRDRRESELGSPYAKYGKKPFKYPFVTGAAYAEACARGSITDPGERWRT